MEIDFTVRDAQKILNESKHRKEFIYLKFQASIVNQIRARAEKKLTSFSYTVPAYVYGLGKYNPDDALLWLKTTFDNNGFDTAVNYYKRKIFISWKPNPTEIIIKKKKIKPVPRSAVFPYFL